MWQWEVFKRVHKYYKGKSILTWGKADLKAECFPHLFPKGAYQSMKLLDRNIVLVSSVEEHEMIDKIFNLIRKDRGKIYLMQRIKQWDDLSWMIREYYENELSL